MSEKEFNTKTDTQSQCDDTKISLTVFQVTAEFLCFFVNQYRISMTTKLPPYPIYQSEVSREAAVHEFTSTNRAA